jgi:hypothetical protein
LNVIGVPEVNDIVLFLLESGIIVVGIETSVDIFIFSSSSGDRCRLRVGFGSMGSFEGDPSASLLGGDEGGLAW